MTQDEATLAVDFLFRMEAELGTRALIENGPQGSRVIRNVTGGWFEGPRLNGTIEAPGGDWVTNRADATSARIDVRLTLRAHDGAVILMTYNGILLRPETGDVVIRTAPLFETGDARYTWLNRVQAVGIGQLRDTSAVTYDVYGLR
jgi:hypothetical protein